VLVRVVPTWHGNGDLWCDERTDHEVFGVATRLPCEYDYRDRLVWVSGWPGGE
jgi:hypothetical protein